MRVAKQDQLAVGGFDQPGQVEEVFGGDHRGFVTDHDRSRRQGVFS